MMSACAVIPCFNHGATAGAVAARVRAHGLPVLIVDDGSDADSARALDAIEGVRVLRLEKNGGKGAAVMRGLREAQRLGYTHALQIDADGQHATDDVPRFLEKGRARDDAVVCGDPVFDASAPKSRRYGRWITRFWVWLETRGRARGDALCGFRLYPLARTVALLDRARIATGMSFDVDILVRLVWEGLPVESVQTRVVYPPGGRSHFRLLRDNLRISATHTRLFFASFAPRSAAAHWSRLSERGALWGLRFLVAAYRLGGRPLFRAFLYPVMLYFFLFGSVARRASRDFLRRAHRAGSPRLPSPPTWRDSFRHFLAFADATLDKVGAWLDRVPSRALELVDDRAWARLRANGRGSLLIGSHLGNLEVPRAFARGERAGAAVTALVFTQHAQNFNRLLRELQPEASFNLVEVGSIGPDTAIDLRAVIDRGDLVVIVGDRTPVHSTGRTARVPFLGADAEFSLGPYILGHLLECPVHLLFCLHDGERYREYLEPFAERISWTRATRDRALQEYARRYAERLQHYALRAPFQWFNFFDFWHAPLRRS
ncbi:MAG TPA: glycosyltransferase [Burkholderiales bacterium]